MTTVRNPARERLEAGELALGVGLRQARTVDIGPVMKACGFDYLFIDLEHNTMNLDMAAQISVAAHLAGIAPIVRVPGFDRHLATRVLDGGAMGVVVPHVDTAEQAAEIVAACKYPPVGHRSVTGMLSQTGFARLPMGETTEIINAATLVVMMVETPAAVENVEAIAATPGLDVLLVGTNDLCVEMGIPGDVGNPRVAEAYERVIAACRANDVWPGLGGVYDPPLMERYIAMGMRFILAGNDITLMMAAAGERAATLRGFHVG